MTDLLGVAHWISLSESRIKRIGGMMPATKMKANNRRWRPIHQSLPLSQIALALPAFLHLAKLFTWYSLETINKRGKHHVNKTNRCRHFGSSAQRSRHYCHSCR